MHITVRDSSANDTPVEDADLTAVIAYDGQTKGLNLETTDDTPGEYFGALVPTKAGNYTVHISGSLGGSPVQKDIRLEKVTTTAEEGFPSGHATVGAIDSRATVALWGGIGAGLLGLIIAIVALVVALGARSARQAPPPAPRSPPPPARRL